MDVSSLTFYLALLQLQMAILGFVIAGVVALIQMLSNAKPKRSASLLIRQRTLNMYIGFLAGLLLLIAVGSWVTAFPVKSTILLGTTTTHFFGSPVTSLILLLCCISGLLMLAYLTFRARHILDVVSYLRTYVAMTSPKDTRAYVAHIYGYSTALNAPTTRRRISHTSDSATISYDPFQPIREYLKDSSFKLYDYGTATGLKLFVELYQKSFTAAVQKPGPQELYNFSKYFSESALEFFTIFQKTVSEKRKMDMIRLVHAQGEALLAARSHDGMLSIVNCLEAIGKLSNDDEEIIAVINAMHELADAFLTQHASSHWAKVATTFEEICLSITRLSETYYLQKENPLKTMPVIGYSTGEHRTVTAAFVGFYVAYIDLADKYPDAYPIYYFEAIEAVIEALFTRLAELVEKGQANVAYNRRYHELAQSLYQLYRKFGIDAIEHGKPELLALCLGNMRRIIKPAKNLHLDEVRLELTEMIVDLAQQGITGFGNIKLKGERTISVYIQETLEKHATEKDLQAAYDNLSVNADGQQHSTPEITILKALTGHA